MPPARLRWVLFGGVFALVFACFAADLGNALLAWDDACYVVSNERIRTLSGSTVAWAFTEFHCYYWAPLTWLSLALDHALWGLDPVGYHLTNNLLHALTAALFFLVVHRLLRRSGPEDDGPGQVPPRVLLWLAALAAALFGVHPLRVESVAWVAERKDVLSMAFGMGAVLAYLRHAERSGVDPGPRAEWAFLRSPAYWGMLGSFALSLLSKAMLVTLPLVFLVLDRVPLGRHRREGLRALLLEKAPMFVLAGLAALVTAQAMAPSSKGLAEIDAGTRVLVAFGAIARYVRLTVIPEGMSPVQFHPGSVSLGVEQAAAIALVVGLTVVALRAARRWPAPLAAWLVFLITLFPVLGLLQNGPQELAARFTYFPSMALWGLGAAGGRILWSRTAAPLRPALGAAAAVLLLGLAALTVREIGFWRDDVALWSRVIELEPHRFGKAYFLRARALSQAGRLEEALADADEALEIAARKRFAGIHENYAQVARLRRSLGDVDGAGRFFDRAIELSTPPASERYRFERDGLQWTDGGGGDPHGGPGAPAVPPHDAR